MRFDKSKVKTVRADIDAALASVEKKHGVKFSLGTIRFTANDFRAKLECVSTVTSNGSAVNADQVKFENQAARFGIRTDSFGKTFTYFGDRYKIVGLNPRAKKYPVQAQGPRGKRYKMPVSYLPDSLLRV